MQIEWIRLLKVNASEMFILSQNAFFFFFLKHLELIPASYVRQKM